MTLLMAGHETTATALAWAFDLLFRAPDKLERLREEVDAGEPRLSRRRRSRRRCGSARWSRS